MGKPQAPERPIDAVSRRYERLAGVQAKRNRIAATPAGMRVPDPYARKLQLPKMPGKKQTGMAMDDVAPGAYPMGNYLGGDSFSLYFPGYPYLALLAQRTEYIQPVKTHALDMTREWIEFVSKGRKKKAGKIRELEQRCKELDLQGVIRKALVHDGFFGVGHIFIDLKGHDDTKLPIVLDPRSVKKGTLRAFRNIEPMWVTPVVWNSAKVELPSFYVPDSWWALDIEVHKSRLLQVISNEAPDILKPAYNFGGISLSQLIQPYVDRWLRTVTAVSRMISNYSLIYLATDMSAVLEDGDDGADMLRRLQISRAQGDNMGAFAIDKATESLNQIAVPLSGLAELQQQALEHMAYPTHEPLVVLTGVTPAGLNASSAGEIEVYHDWNRAQQIAYVRPVLRPMIQLVMLDLWGKIDEDIDFLFKPIKQITGQELAEIKKTQAEEAVALIDARVVSAEEVREKYAHDENSGFENLDVESPPPPLEEQPDSQEGEEIGGKPAGEFVREAA